MVEVTIRMEEDKKKKIRCDVIRDVLEIDWERLDYNSISAKTKVVLCGLLFWIVDSVIEKAYREGYKEGHCVGFNEGLDNWGIKGL